MEESRVLWSHTVKKGFPMKNLWNDLDHLKVFYHSWPARLHRCVRAHVWSQSACVDGFKRGNTYGSFSKLKQLATLRLQLDCSKGGVAHESIHPPSRSAGTHACAASISMWTKLWHELTSGSPDRKWISAIGPWCPRLHESHCHAFLCVPDQTPTSDSHESVGLFFFF